VKLARRGFLKAIAAAPIAAPVAAKEAASKIGMGQMLGNASGGMPTPIGYSQLMPHSEDRESYAMRVIRELDGGERDEEIANEAKCAGRTLDCDLAALRSVSVSFAYQTQCARHAVEIKRRRRSDMLRELTKMGKGGWFG